MGPPCNKLLPPPLPCSRNDAKLSVISRVFALPMESASSSSSRSLDDGEKERRGEGAGERGGRGADADIDLFLAITRTICFLV